MDVGGRFAGYLRSCGLDGLVIMGKADTPVYLHFSDVAAEIRRANPLWGQEIYRTHEMLELEIQRRISSVAIGPAGERQVLLSSIVLDVKDARVAARCGVGAVMG